MNKASTWTTRQTEPAVWDTLLPEQRERLEALGLKRRTDTATAAATTAASRAGAFERGIAALTQYAAREGRVVVPRAHVEETPHGPGRLGTWVSNTRSRRAKLSSAPRSASTGPQPPDTRTMNPPSRAPQRTGSGRARPGIPQ
ncbi:helicase associated domain-containing protein [Streptomyces globisporus]|uniref:helicase associated domain-containing protein n=1 Tax=Streptomyces globisporus TaxID=1908 RepID=UPI0034610D20|nr:helicase associated domain-containing protein [Streptomyces globisporus]